ncbi:MAG: tRNA (guanosine(37)-N1)-methyltransferase TrmD [bacterium]|nr:tRNA (guanosine(37)-N1)-methyltransferase TrmD [bacterium]
MPSITFICLFPDEMRHVFLKGILGKAQENGTINVTFVNARDFSEAPHHKVDDYPFGKKHGMLLRYDVLYNAITSVPNYKHATIIYTCPKGPHFNQAHAQEMADTLLPNPTSHPIIFICGYYEGIDERMFDTFKIQRYSVGDFVLSSGELPAMMMAEAAIRLLPGVVGKSASVAHDSIISGRLEEPYYTQPRESYGQHVPEVLLSGNHGKIDNWKTIESIRQTVFKKPSLLVKHPCNENEKLLVRELMKEN